MMDETNQSPFFQDLNEIYKERELLFKQREQDYLKQKIALTNLMEVIKKEKGELEKTAEELERKQEELRKEEEYQQSWYQQICEEKKQMDKEREQIKIEKEDLNAKKDAIEVKFQIQIEKAKNTEILANQRKEEYEHKLNMLGLVLDADGKPGTESTKFFESLLGGTEDVEKLQGLEAEKNRLLNLVSNISQEKEIPVESEQGEEDVLNFGTDEEEEYIPTFGQKKSEQEIDVEDEVFEELTAPILQKYLAGSEVKYISSEIRHSEEGEQLHANINNLDYVFLFSQPAAFEISVPKKKSRALDRLLIRLNTQHPGVKFYFDENDSRVYASGYFSNTMIPENLMKKVHEVSDCFRQK